MRPLGEFAFAALLSATPFCNVPAFAAEMHDNMMGDAMHPMMHHVTCKDAGASETGDMMVEFHNMGREALPAGTKLHWRMKGMAQGDMTLMEAVPAGGMKSQTFMMHDATSHMSSDAMHSSGHMMAGHAPCSVEAM